MEVKFGTMVNTLKKKLELMEKYHVAQARMIRSHEKTLLEQETSIKNIRETSKNMHMAQARIIIEQQNKITEQKEIIQELRLLLNVLMFKKYSKKNKNQHSVSDVETFWNNM
jgi:hypothetical protein